MNDAFSVTHMFLLGWPVLSVLLLCSVISISVILERFVYFRKRKVNVPDFSQKVEKVILSGKDSAQQCAQFGEPLSTIAQTALAHVNRPKEAMSLAVDRAVRMQINDMEQFVPFLGSIAGAAPFIGLLGTVLGIIRAFKTLSISGGGGPQVVTGGIAEALVATAVGLLVAIPALLAYNYYSTKIRRLTENMEICADQILEILTRK